MTAATLPALDSFSPNPDWARLPLFDRRGWRTMAFGEFAESVNERVEPANAAEEIYVGLDDLDSGSLHIKRWGKGSDVIGSKLRFRKGDIIFGRRRAYQRKLAVADMEGICSAHAMVVRARPGLVHPEFLPFLMMSDRFMSRAIEISVGSLSPTINWTTLKHEPFDLPPLDQQLSIAGLLWAIDETKREVEKSSTALAVVRRATMAKAFSEPTFPVVSIRESGQIQLGRQRAPKYQTGAFTKPYLRVANVFDGFIDYSDVLEMDFDERDSQAYGLQIGDILLNEGQSRELVGRCAIYDGQLPECCFQNTLIRYRVGGKVLMNYAFAFFQHCYHTGIFAAISSQTTSIAHLGADRFAKLRMPIPPRHVQEEIADSYEQIRMAERAALKHASTINELQSAIADMVTQ